VIVGIATVRATAIENVVIFVTPPPEAETVIRKLPAGVEFVVLIFNTDEQFGVQVGDENTPLAPVGNPVTAKSTGWAMPAVAVAVTVFTTDEPPSTVLSPELDNMKSNDWMGFTVNVKVVIRVSPPPAAVTVIG
jgi:hypothetical protein